MATDQEYGPALRSKMKPLITRVGPVGASIGATRALAGLQAQGSLPDLVVALRHFWICRVSSIYRYTSMAFQKLGFRPEQTLFQAQPMKY